MTLPIPVYTRRVTRHADAHHADYGPVIQSETWWEAWSPDAAGQFRRGKSRAEAIGLLLSEVLQECFFFHHLAPVAAAKTIGDHLAGPWAKGGAA